MLPTSPPFIFLVIQLGTGRPNLLQEVWVWSLVQQPFRNSNSYLAPDLGDLVQGLSDSDAGGPRAGP